MSGELPFVSVIMPVRNEGGFAARSVAAVLDQDYPAERMEVIVVDGLSTDGTRETVETLRARHPNLRLLDNPGRIVPTGLNLAIRDARGDILIRVDGHCEVARDYVRRCVDHLRRDGVDAVGGPLETVGETPLARDIAFAMSSTFGVGGADFRTKADRTMLTDTVAFPAYTRSAIERTGRFDEELVRNQDDEYNTRLRKLGGKILLAEDVRSRYYSRGTLGSLARQYFQYGYWKVRVIQKHPRGVQARQLAPPLFALLLAAGLLAAPWGRAGRWVLGLAAGSYGAANLAASAVIASRRGGRFFPLSAALGAMHLAYGSGFLAGLLRFWGRWGARKNPPDRPEPASGESAPSWRMRSGENR